MTESPSNASQPTQAPGSWGAALRDLLFNKAVPSVAGALGLAGFMALIGAAVTWFRFQAAGLPAYDAIEVIPHSQLIPVGATSVIVFLLVGAAATFLVYGLDANRRRTDHATGTPGKKGEITWGAGFGVAALGLAEVLIAIWLFRPEPELGAVASVAVVLATVGMLGTATVSSWGHDWEWARRAIESRELRRAGTAAPWLALAILGGVAGTALVGVIEARLLLALLAAVVFSLVCLGAARGANTFFWLGACVFLTAGLFGAAITFLRTDRTPKVQPIAVLRTDGPPVCALFVANTEERLYLARVDAAGRKPAVGSGRLFSLSAEHVAAQNLGTLTGLKSAPQRFPVLLEELRDDNPALRGADATSPSCAAR